jgi:putative acetyltransferase
LRWREAVLIRDATRDDFGGVDAVHVAAFESTSFGHQGEAALVRAVHADGDALVSLVAELDGRIVAHALFSRMRVEADGVLLRAAALAPVGVLPALHGTGIGSALIRAGLERLREHGIEISFVLGHPDYYPRFGYSAAAALPFASPYAGPHFMALWLDKPPRLPESGTAAYAPAFSHN